LCLNKYKVFTYNTRFQKTFDVILIDDLMYHKIYMSNNTVDTFMEECCISFLEILQETA
jgi:hypothetical protein